MISVLGCYGNCSDMIHQFRHLATVTMVNSMGHSENIYMSCELCACLDFILSDTVTFDLYLFTSPFP